jgi:hypothetical protein
MTFWKLEFELAKIADEFAVSRKDLIKKFDYFPIDVQDRIESIIEQQIAVMLEENRSVAKQANGPQRTECMGNVIYLKSKKMM